MDKDRTPREFIAADLAAADFIDAKRGPEGMPPQGVHRRVTGQRLPGCDHALGLVGRRTLGVLSIRIESSASGARVSLTYAVGGYFARGFEELSKGVDQVLALQLERLKRLIETGRPTAQAT